jgi:tetratricopeptide (TPR) repeat protein
MQTKTRHRVLVDNSALAVQIGQRLRAARLQEGLTQQQLAAGRYTKAYVSALETGTSKPSMAALHFLADRLGVPVERLLRDEASRWTRLSADLELASGHWEEAADAYADLLVGQLDATTRAELLRGLSEALCRLDRGEEAVASAAESVELFVRLRRPRDAALARYWLAFALFQHENPGEARAHLQALLDGARLAPDAEPDFRFRVLVALAAVESVEGQYAAALACLEEARALTEGLDDRRRAAFLYAVAYGRMGAGDLEGAVRSGMQSLALYRAADSELEAAFVENDLALVYLRMGSLDRARELAEGARSHLERTGDRKALAHVVETQAQIALAGGSMDGAVALAGEAIRLAGEHGNRKALSSALLTRARASALLARTDDAITDYREVVAIAREYGPRARLREALSGWADVLAALGRHAEAYEISREALQLDRGQA